MSLLMRSSMANAAPSTPAVSGDESTSGDFGSGVALRWALLVLGIILGALIVEFVQLRENRAFWLDHDLYPVRLRSLVLQMFYPLVWMQGFLLIIASLVMLLANPGATHAKSYQSGILILLWIALAGSLFTAVENNVSNVLEGRPLHWHPEDTLAYSPR